MKSQRKSSQKSHAAASLRDAEGELAAEYREAYPRLVAIAAGILGEAIGAEDVVQQAAQITIEKDEHFDSGPSLVRWLAAVTRNCALNERRRRRRRRTFAEDPDRMAGFPDRPAESGALPPVDPRTGELLAGQSAFGDEVLAAIRQLSEDARCCLLLRVIHNASYEEIAELVDIPAGTAMSHVFRGKKSLRDYLRHHSDFERAFVSRSVE